MRQRFGQGDSATHQPQDGEEFETGRPLVRRGSSGGSVRELQTLLAARGFNPGPVDGAFGGQTDAAVRAFQSSRGIAVDGIVGEQTWGLLLAGTGVTPTAPPVGVGAEQWLLPGSVRLAGEAQSVRYDGAPAWDGGRNCTGTFTSGAAELRTYIRANFRGVSDIGGYSCRANSATASATSIHGVGRALDIMIPQLGSRANSAVGDPIANWLVLNAEAIGIQYLIWNKIQWSASRSGRKDRPYTGPSPHTDHIHAELNRDGAARLTAWFSGHASTPPPARSTPMSGELAAPAQATPRRPIDRKVVERIQRFAAVIDAIPVSLERTPNLLRGIIAAESGGRPDSGAGTSGYKGLLQASQDPRHLDAETSIREGAEHFLEMRGYLKAALKKLGIELERMPRAHRLAAILASYNAGQVTVARAIALANSADPARWLATDVYGRALIFTGAYAIHARCLTAKGSSSERATALAWLKSQKRKTFPSWEAALATAPRAARCSLTAKVEATPGYLTRILQYRAHFDGLN